jgi:glycosyltransferase involved in cell wall biosynthesis
VLAKKFMLGPVGGGQRVPPAFRAEVEGSEPWYFKLRLLDRWRLRHDPIVRRTFGKADLILAIGSYMWEMIPGEFHAKCELMLETGIDCERFRGTALSGRPDQRCIKLLYVGRVVPYKGLIYCLKAVARLSAALRSRFELVVIGDRGEGGYERACKNFVGAMGLGSMVTFLGYRPKAEIVRFYDECDLFVFPSLAETSGNVVLEAMAMARPALVANCGGPAEVVTPDSGYLVAPTSPEAFIEGIKDVLIEVAQDRSQLIGKGMEARKRMESKFDWNRKGEKLMEYYERVLAMP